MSLAEKLVLLRKEKGLTQIDLAERLNVSRQAVSRWEVGASVPSTDNLKALSELYEVSLDCLLSDCVELRGKSSELYDTENSEQENEVNIRGHRQLVKVAVAIIIVVLAVIISVKIAPNQEIEQSTPIENMTKAEAIDDLTYTFSIDP